MNRPCLMHCSRAQPWQLVHQLAPLLARGFLPLPLLALLLLTVQRSHSGRHVLEGSRSWERTSQRPTNARGKVTARRMARMAAVLLPRKRRGQGRCRCQIRTQQQRRSSWAGGCRTPQWPWRAPGRASCMGQMLTLQRPSWPPYCRTATTRAVRHAPGWRCSSGGAA